MKVQYAKYLTLLPVCLRESSVIVLCNAAKNSVHLLAPSRHSTVQGLACSAVGIHRVCFGFHLYQTLYYVKWMLFPRPAFA